MKKIIKLILLINIILFGGTTYGQTRNLLGNVIQKTYADSLLSEFRNTIYTAFYNSSYVMTQTPSFTLLKIDINAIGKITTIQFSDSADSSLLKAWATKRKFYNDEATLEKYANAKSYKNLSLLLIVSFEPNAEKPGQHFTYDQLESLFKFNKKDFTGVSVILPPIFIPVLSENNY